MTVSYPDATIRVEPGQVWFTACWEPHVGYPSAETRLVLFTVLLESLGHVAPFASVPWEAPFLCPCSERPQVVESQLRRFVLERAGEIAAFAEAGEGDEDGSVRNWLRFHELLLPLARMARHDFSSQVSGALKRVRPALDLVRGTQRSVSIDEAATCCGLGRRRFCELFQQSFGVSFGCFALRARLAGAAGALRESDVPMKRIAADWDFHDSSHFHRAFVTHFGVKPSVFRGER